MAAFFPRTIYNTEASFTPLFRLLDDFDSYSRQCQPASTTNNHCKKQQQQHFRKSAVSHWQPKFDVRETSDAYELHGELPGLSKNDVSIEFTEPQTLVVRGKVERNYTAGSAPNAAAAAPAPAAVEEPQLEEPVSHKTTVADEDDASIQEESGFEVVSETSNTAPATPETEAAAAAAPVDQAKYWLTERSIGEFARSFSFPSRVDQDSVTAAFQDGILSISVPKAKKHETIRIAIN
ncbi:30 kDa heat shock protein [Cordyceps fumosorosea ARSEF 2679]|uniref:30 kDa heat shock protein n=1 Tax=Cordyceps fumosorosea (strain ARSEF 2679) TaxID=1081104 RepID=A0A162J7M0_CORFA|nr:30 kDa heat shock protein [Cordyceps fumosorosea ARSEF 2679]OAA64912.1 30 kDa heat shock protein [Cordyceps fumosorosea ARSEF 2679]